MKVKQTKAEQQDHRATPAEGKRTRGEPAAARLRLLRLRDDHRYWHCNR